MKISSRNHHRIIAAFFLLFAGGLILFSHSGDSGTSSFATYREKFTPEELVTIGSRIYNLRGANTCLMCHGLKGQGGSVAEAPHLDKPRKWDLFLALGGEEAWRKNPEKFLHDLETANVHLIRLGAIAWNVKRDQVHPEVKLDWSKTDDPHGKFDPLMYGINQAPTLNEVKKIQKELKKTKGMELKKDQAAELAAYAVYQYVKTLDRENLFSAATPSHENKKN
jgi:hypothetical protein